MANLALTSTCNRSCGFCFAADSMASRNGEAHMSLATVEAAFDFLDRSSVPEARLLGGEPTLHPQFNAIVDRALVRGLQVLVFTGGFIPELALRRLEAVPADRLAVLLNVIPPDAERSSATARQDEVLRRLGRRVMLGVTIDSPGVQLGFLLDLIDRFDLARSVRLGLAHPSMTGGNTYLHPRHYAEVGRRTSAFGLDALARGVALSFDCGWVPCMFPDGALEALGLTAKEMGLRCSPILDLLPDGRFISCYALAAHATEALAGDAQSVRARFAARQQADRAFMLFKTCAACEWRARGACTGGCLSGSLRQTGRHQLDPAALAVAHG